MIAQKVWYFQAVFVLYLVDIVSALYCDFGLCEAEDGIEKYCCGENKCCIKSTDVWYYWAAGFLVVATIMVTACLYMRRFKLRHQSAYSYQRLQTDPNSILQT